MTATYGEVGLSYAAINWAYDGAEILFSTNPTVFLDAEGPYITSESASGALVIFTATNIQGVNR